MSTLLIVGLVLIGGHVVVSLPYVVSGTWAVADGEDFDLPWEIMCITLVLGWSGWICVAVAASLWNALMLWLALVLFGGVVTAITLAVRGFRNWWRARKLEAELAEAVVH